MKVIAMKCASCGAGLQITADMDHFACGYCGASLTIVRQGGTVALNLVADSIAKVQVGTDRTASELALVRLEKKLDRNTKELDTLKIPRRVDSWGGNELELLKSSFVIGLIGSIWGGPLIFFASFITVLIWVLFARDRRIQREKSFISFCESEIMRLETERSLIIKQIKHNENIVKQL